MTIFIRICTELDSAVDHEGRQTFWFIRILSTIVTEIRMSNFYLVWKWNHSIRHQLQVTIELKKINELTLTCVTFVFQLTT